MKFNTLDEVAKHFNIESTDVDHIKKELKNLIKDIHPDKNNGEFKSEHEKIIYNKIVEAFEFLESSNTTSVVAKNDIVALTKGIYEIILSKENDIYKEKIDGKVATLSNSIQESIKNFHNHNSTTRVTSIVIATLITALWMFPNFVKEHPFWGVLYYYNFEFSVIWVILLILSGALWLKIKIIEQKDGEIKRSYKFESTQNSIFRLFVAWMSIDFKNTEIKGDGKRFMIFTKDDLIDFLTTRYVFYSKNIGRINNLSTYQIEKVIEEIETEYQQKRKNIPDGLPLDLLPKPGEIDLEMADLISVLIIERLIGRRMIARLSKNSLSDIYEFELKN